MNEVFAAEETYKRNIDRSSDHKSLFVKTLIQAFELTVIVPYMTNMKNYELYD